MGQAPSYNRETDVSAAEDAVFVGRFAVMWWCAAILWFVVPYATMATDPFYQADAAHALLAVTIAAAYPLSWHLSLAAIPSASHPFLAPLLGLAPATMKACHVRAAHATVFWGIVHAAGEVIYLASQNMLDVFDITAGSSEDDRLLYFFGLICLGLLVVLSVLAFSRKSLSVAPRFRVSHRVLAICLLLFASAHWWPFAIFLLPVVACLATAIAVEWGKRVFRGTDQIDGVVYVALAVATTAAIAGLVIVWGLRQRYILANPSEFFQLGGQMFPPASIALAFLLAWCGAAAVVMRQGKKRHGVASKSYVSLVASPRC